MLTRCGARCAWPTVSCKSAAAPRPSRRRGKPPRGGRNGTGATPPALTMRPSAAPAAAAIRNRQVDRRGQSGRCGGRSGRGRLKQAVSAGWSNAASVAADHVLDGLRGRQDFQELVARLGGHAKSPVERSAVLIQPDSGPSIRGQAPPGPEIAIKSINRATFRAEDQYG